MGWCSATGIFDEAIYAAYRLQLDTLESARCEQPEFPNPDLVEFAKTIRDVLENGDWDCQQESDYYQALKYDLWPESAAEDDYWDAKFREEGNDQF